MNRRTFVNNLFEYTIKGGLIIVAPTRLLLETLHKSSTDFVPYTMDITDDGMQTDLINMHMPIAVKRKAIQMTPNKRIWIAGEGRNNLLNQNIKFKAPISKAYTPVKKLVGVKGGHEVDGQWFEVRPKYLKGVIKGFDGVYYSVHHNFMNIFTNKYNCYGLPSKNYVVTECSLGNCGSQYIYQDFNPSCKSETIRLYTWYKGCKNSSTGNHDNLDLSKIEPCGASDTFDIGSDF